MTELGRRGHDPMLRKVNETVRLELVSGKKTDRWLVRIEKGDVSVSHKGGAADTVIRVDKELFERMARGDANPVAAVLRGDVSWEGDWASLVAIQRLFPAQQAPSQAPPSAPAGKTR
ncbi:MAG TPA: SCP2 sterol-binding domain-containing protein [Gaiellaceae bacterium]|jgi:putative sterol carrier protein|nr:SCP2 sterol-binding domain-containing protein [Gaiellaceae bacterium]